MKRKTGLLPYFLVRIAAGSLSDFKEMELQSTVRLLDEVRKTNEKYAQLRGRISDKLHSYITTLDDNVSRHALIQLRRDVYNGRAIDNIPHSGGVSLPSEYTVLLDSYTHLREKVAALQSKGEQSYRQEYQKSKRAFYALLRQPVFTKGILLASATLSDSFEKYRKTIHDPAKAISKFERSLLEYLSRMHTKPSPFSTFTQVGVATIDDKENAQPVTQSHIVLNHIIYGHLFGLLVRHQSLRKRLVIKPNATIYEDNGRLVFLDNKNTTETLRRVVTTPALVTLRSALQAQPVQRYDEFVLSMVGKGKIAATKAELEEYVDRLLDVGFFVFDLGAVGTENDWDAKLLQSMLPLAGTVPIANELAKALRLLKKLSVQYEESSVAERRLLLPRAFQLLKDICESIKKDGGIVEEDPEPAESGVGTASRSSYSLQLPFPRHKLWYEDTAMSAATHLPIAIRTKLDALGGLLSALEGLDTCAYRRLVLADFFVGRFGTGAEVPILDLYEAYYQKEEHPAGSSVAGRDERSMQWFEALFSRMQWPATKAEQIDIAAGDVPPNASSHIAAQTSFGAFFQINEDGDSQSIVVNDTVPGFGKMFSRFLYIFPAEVTEAFREWNRPKHKSQLLVEPIDGSLLNASIHPDILAYAIQPQGGGREDSTMQWIAPQDISVTYDAQANRLRLTDRKRNKELLVTDVSAQAIMTRSRLYQLLSLFAPCDHHELHALRHEVNKRARVLLGGNVTLYPRIVYEGIVVLQRKTWEFSSESVPRRTGQESDWLYLQKIDTWRLGLGMPNEVFVKIAASKPQYIAFRNPLLVALLERITSQGAILQISEMLPAINKKRPAAEFLAHWYF